MMCNLYYMNNISVEKSDGRIGKKIRYDAERKKVIDSMDQIMGFKDGVRSFCVNDLDQDTDKKKKIVEMEGEICKYFNYGNWPYFTSRTKKEHLSLLKSLYKDMGYKLDAQRVKIKLDNGFSKITTTYNIIM